MQRQHVHHAQRDRTLEGFTGAAVEQRDLLLGSGQALLLRDVFRIGEVQHAADFVLMRTIEHRRRERHALLQVLGQLQDLGVGQAVQIFDLAALVVDPTQQLAHFGGLGLRLEHVADALAQTARGPAQVGFENLTHVHPRRHAQRVQHDVCRRTVSHVRHVFDRGDLRHDTLVTVTAGHLVARLQAALHGQVHLDHLDHARRQFIALRELLALLFEREVEVVALLLDGFLHGFELGGHFVIRRADVEPVPLVEVG